MEIALARALPAGLGESPFLTAARVPSAMTLPRRRFLHLAMGAAALPAVARIARAQAYPSRPITIVEPFAAGGPIDTIGRILAERMRVSLGQPVVIENVAGASGTLALGRVARAAPDGYTISHGSTPTHVFSGAVFKLPFDLEDDFQPISPIASAPLLIVAKKAVAANDLEEFIAWLKANPDKASQGTGGVAATSHIAGIFFQQVSGTRFALVPYRGAGPAMQDLIAGQIDMMIDPASNTLPHARAGRIKALAVTARERLKAAPDIPTVDEAGLPGFAFENWHGFFAPKGAPPAVVARLNAAVVETLADPAVRARLVDLGQEIFPREQQTPEALAAMLRAGIEKWGPIIRAAGIKAE
jgi:tripartite-type tricarboxylate transporter receptor subunit TctC